MTKDEALKLALEALELNNEEWKSLADSGDCGYWNAEDQDHYKQTNKAITAIKQALAAPVHPVASLKEADVLMMAEAHGIDPGTKGLYGFYIDCISTAPPAQPAPPECQTEAEKTAFAFGWWKALESQREQRPIKTFHGGKPWPVQEPAPSIWTPSHWTEYERDIRNAALDEIAAKIALMPFGDTAASFAVWIKEQKT